MCECKFAVEPGEGHWAWKLLGGLITGALIVSVLTDPRAR